MTTRDLSVIPLAMLSVAFFGLLPPTSRGASYQILGWNNLGMHCMDSDYSVFSILPPYNTIECQLISGGKLVTNGTGYTVTYEAVADPTGSFNSTSLGKGNFYQFTAQLYEPLAVDAGLAGWHMPGASNTPQSMIFEQTNFVRVNWFRAEGIPLTTYDDTLHKNPYPMMRLVARDAGDNIIATNSIVLPISDEMDCRACHATGSYANARPAAGWVSDSNPERDFRLNILRLHDERQFVQYPALYAEALSSNAFNAAGLYTSVATDNKPVLCAICHASAALGTVGFTNTLPLTQAVHAHHATVPDPTLGITLDSSLNRAACYRCHPGSTTRCLRGAMGAAVAADGSMAMQCQSCHGNMSQVGANNRQGWLTEPACQSCHSGTATHNNGQIRYTSAFTDTNFTVRVAVDQTFATQANAPAAGLSLYRFSSGHGGLQCEACHGSTHAEFPSSHLNDNVRNIAIQGHAGMMVECTACHTAMPDTPNGGPHGMHAIGQGWVSGSGGVTKHADQIGSLPGGVAACQPCHGTDFRGTVLSRAQADRTLRSGFDAGSVTNQLFRGAIIGCYTCHNGPANDNPNNSAPPTVGNVFTNTTNAKAVAMLLPAAGGGLTLRIISQPGNGSVGLNTNTGVATYFPNSSFVGTDTFTFAAYNGSKNSNLGIGTVVVAQGSFLIPALSATASGDSISMTWPAALTGVTLYQSPSIGPDANWTPCTNAVVPVGNTMSVTLQNPTGVMFYQLR